MAERTNASLEFGTDLGMMRHVPSASWSIRHSCSGPPVKAGSDDQFSVPGGGQRAVRAGDGDLEIRRAGVAAGVGHGCNRPLLLRLAQVICHADVDVARGPVLRDFGDILRRNRGARAGEHSSPAAIAARSCPGAAPGPLPVRRRPCRPCRAVHPPAYLPRPVRAPYRCPRIRSRRCLPSSSRRQPASRLSTAAGGYPARWRRPCPGRLQSAVENFCTPSPRSRRPKWPGPTTRPPEPSEQLSAALDHIDALAVEEGTGHFLRAAHPYVVAGVGAAAATAVRGQQVIPAIVIHHVGLASQLMARSRGWSLGLRRLPVLGSSSTSRI